MFFGLGVIISNTYNFSHDAPLSFPCAEQVTIFIKEGLVLSKKYGLLLMLTAYKAI